MKLLRSFLDTGLTRAAFLAAGLAACGGEDPDPGPADGGVAPDGGAGVVDLEIAGTWTSNFGGTETITAERWGTAAVITFDNARNSAVLQNPPDDAFAPDLFARVMWTEPAADAFHYCWVDFGLETRMAAETSTRTADPSRPDQTGCGGFPWTRLERQR